VTYFSVALEHEALLRMGQEAVAYALKHVHELSSKLFLYSSSISRDHITTSCVHIGNTPFIVLLTSASVYVAEGVK
jgi:hypothetical protein